MKTAKEICQELRDNELRSIINKVLFDGGSAKFGVYESKADKHYADLNTFELVKKYKSELESLGYKVEEKVYKETCYVVENVVDYVIPKSSFLGIFTIPEKTIYKRQQGTKVISEIPYFEVSACCGE